MDLQVAKRHPLLIVWAVSLAVTLATLFVNPLYDDRGLGMVFFLVSLILTLPYRVVMMGLGWIPDPTVRYVIALALGSILFFLADFLWTRIKKHRDATEVT